MMTRETGDASFPIWLLGDSNPVQWQDSLSTPLDPRHPIRHNIWTSLLDEMQDVAFRALESRIDSSRVFIRNAVADPALKPPSTHESWPTATTNECEELRSLLGHHHPALLLCFGSFSFEFARRAMEEQPQRPYAYWGASQLGAEFRLRVSRFELSATSLLPLLHRSISGGRFLASHDQYCGRPGANYFEVVGRAIGHALVQHAALPVWIIDRTTT